MAKFTAGTAVEPLEWDFTKYQPAPTEGQAVAPWGGTIPEPTQAALERFNAALVAAAPTGDAARLSEVTDMSVLDPIKRALADLCGNLPSVAQLDALPFRVLVAFIGWLAGRLTNPQ